MSYNLFLLKYQRAFGFDLVCFDRLTVDYHKKLTQIVAKLNLTEPENGFSFLESNLHQKYTSDGEEIPINVLEMYHTLRTIAD